MPRLAVYRIKQKITLIVALTAALLMAPAVQAKCTDVACLTGDGGVVSLNPANGPLLGPIISALLPGTELEVGLIDHEAIAHADLDLRLFIDLLVLETGVGSPSELLAADVTLLQFLNVAAQAVEADGDLAPVQALNSSLLAIPGIEDLRIPIGELLVADFDEGYFTDVRVNLLDFVMAGVQLFNHENAFASPEPVSINTPALLGPLGLNGIAETVDLYVQVVEPPRIGCAEVGTVFRSPAVRIKLDVELLDINNQSTALLAALDALLGPLVEVDAEVVAGRLEFYFEIGSSAAVVTEINPDLPQAILEVQPGVATAWLGEMDNEVFFDPNYRLNPEDLRYAQLLEIHTELDLLQGPVANAGMAVEVRSHSMENRDPERFVMSGPFPETVRTSGNSSSLADLVGALLENLEFRTTLDPSNSDAALDPVLGAVGVTTAALLETVELAADGIVDDLIILLADAGVLEAVIDPVLELLGVDLGWAEYTLHGVAAVCDLDGYVYHDRDVNQRKGGGEEGCAELLYAKLRQVDPVSGEFQVSVTNVDSATGYYQFPSALSGDGTIVISVNDDADDFVGRYPPGWVGTEAPNFERDIAVADFAQYNFGVIQGAYIVGYVFHDNGAGGGVANDGQQQPGEQGINGSLLTLRDASGTVLGTARSDSAGRYAFWTQQSATVFIQQQNVSPYTVSTGADTAEGLGDAQYDSQTDTIMLQVENGQRYGSLDFGDVRPNRWQPNHNAVFAAGEAQLYAHQYHAETSGRVVFSLQQTELEGWQVKLWQDNDCDAKISAADNLLQTHYDLTAEQSLCVLVEVQSPADGVANQEHKLDLEADFIYRNTQLPLSQKLVVSDRSKILDGSGVSLVKTADKQAAKPGETVTFTLHYHNQGTLPVSNVVIQDGLPAYTEYVAADCEAGLPSSIVSCEVRQQQRLIEWHLHGALAPAAEGHVSLTVRLQ